VTKRDFDAASRREMRGRLNSEEALDSATSVGQWIFALEQQKVIQLLEAHQDLSFFRSLLAHARSGRRLSPRQIAKAYEIATEKGWKIPAANVVASSSWDDLERMRPGTADLELLADVFLAREVRPKTGRRSAPRRRRNSDRRAV
jgi:hypothetical protein